MSENYENIKSTALKNVAELMCMAARTAPKARGMDNLVITILDETDKQTVMSGMKAIAESNSRPSCLRDAENIKNIDNIVLIGTKKNSLELDCGFCGYPSCKELEKTNGVCAYNSMDLGIALGSASSVAGRSHVDNRLMYSIGKAALETGVLPEDTVMAIGIPLSATGKNPFFDRS